MLSGGLATADGPVDARAVAPTLPDGFTLQQVATFAWPATILEPTVERRPETLGRRSFDLVLYRAERAQR